jgi:hypothetical protein
LQLRGKLPVEGEVGNCGDQPDENPGDDSAQGTDDQGHSREQKDPRVASKIRKPIFKGFDQITHGYHTSASFILPTEGASEGKGTRRDP